MSAALEALEAWLPDVGADAIHLDAVSIDAEARANLWSFGPVYSAGTCAARTHIAGAFDEGNFDNEVAGEISEPITMVFLFPLVEYGDYSQYWLKYIGNMLIHSTTTHLLIVLFRRHLSVSFMIGRDAPRRTRN